MAATNAFLQAPPDSTGKKMAASQVTDESTNDVLRQEVIITDPEAATRRLRVYNEDAAHASNDTGLMMLAVRNDADASPVSADGDYQALQANRYGRLKVSAAPADMALTLGNITTIGNTVACDVTRAGSLMAYVIGTFTTANCIFEGSLDSTNGSDGNWFGIQASRSNANTIETTTGNLSAAPAYGWKIGTNGLNWVRVRATAIASGTQNWQLAPSATAIEPAPAVGAHAVTLAAGTVTGTLAHDAANSTQAPVTVGGNARATNIAAVADNDVARIITDLHGRMVVHLGNVPQLVDRNRVVLSAATETTLIAAVASIRHVATKITIANLNTTNPVQVDLRDTTGGTIRDTVMLAAGQSIVLADAHGMPAAAVNTNWTAQATGTSPNVAVSAYSYRVGY